MSVTNEITSMQNQTAFYKLQESRNTAGSSIQDVNDSNMFLTLMLKQLEHQDPTEPTDNAQWLSQLAQYSSLEQMSQMNSGLTDCAKYINAMYNDMTLNSEISQTLSMIGKDVTLKVPNENDPKHPTTVTGRVTEASFETGTGQIKINDQYYSIEDIVSIRE